MRSPEKFAKMLTQSIYRIKGFSQEKSIEIIQDEIGFALGKSGASIEFWRRGHIPPKMNDVESLSRELVRKAGVDYYWLSEFLDSAGYPSIENLLTELFPEHILPNSMTEADNSLTSQIISEHLTRKRYDLKLNIQQIMILVLSLLIGGMLLILWLNLRSQPASHTNDVSLEPSETDFNLEPTRFIPTSDIISLCGESSRLEEPKNQRFLRGQGVSAFTIENTPNGILENRIRSLAGTNYGVLIGYFNDVPGAMNGVSYYDRSVEKSWSNCNDAGTTKGKLINSILIGLDGKIWVGTDGDGILMYDGSKWHQYIETRKQQQILLTYGLTLDKKGDIWAGTWEGAAKYNGETWDLVYTIENELFGKSVHNIMFENNNIWIGLITDGVNAFFGTEGIWQKYVRGPGQLGGNQIRGIVVQNFEEKQSNAIWFATADGGVSRYENGIWTVFRVEDGLPSLTVLAITIDRYNRIWVGTDKGVAYFDGVHWIKYHDLSTLSIAFSPGCSDHSCPQDDHVWTGTDGFGLTHSRLPYTTDGIKVTQICFEAYDRSMECPKFSELQYPHIITATNPMELSPGDTFSFRIEVVPIEGYELQAERGDFLSFAENLDDNLFGAYPIIPVVGSVSSGEYFTFTNLDNPIIAPQLLLSPHQAKFVSSWRVWMHTRYTGPEIRIVFTVK